MRRFLVSLFDIRGPWWLFGAKAVFIVALCCAFSALVGAIAWAIEVAP